MGFKPLKINRDEITFMAGEVNSSIKNAIIDGIPFDTVIEKVLRNEFWTGITDDEIVMCPGFVNGDVTKPLEVALGDKHVHALMGGATGKGKSVTLHALINHLRYKYPPNELAIYHADFKKMEGNKYLNKGGSVHHRAVTGTSQPSYVSSMFRHIKEQMVSREKLFTFGGTSVDLPIEHCSPNQILARLASEVGIEPIEKIAKYKKYLRDGKIDALNIKIQETNIKLKKLGMSMLDTVPTEMPRILFIVDEFQQAFLIDDDNAIDQLKTDIKAITSKGRALGVHLFFASQNMTGTVQDDILGQFDLRFILNCATDVSQDLLGNTLATELDIGQCLVSEFVSDSTGTKAVKVKVPYTSDNDLFKCTMFGVETAKINNMQIAPITYFDETIPEQEMNLKQILTHTKNIGKVPKFVIGKRCKLVKKAAPLLIDIDKGKDSLLIVSTKEEQLYSMLHTILRNIDAKEDAAIIYFDSSKYLETDLSYLTKLDKSNIKINITNTSDMTDAIKSLSSIYENKTLYLVYNKIDSLDGLNRTLIYDDDEDLIPTLIKPPHNVRFVATASKPNINNTLIDSFRYILSGYLGKESQMELGIKYSLADEVNSCEYLSLLTDRNKGVSELFKTYMSTNYKATAGASSLIIE